MKRSTPLYLSVLALPFLGACLSFKASSNVPLHAEPGSLPAVVEGSVVEAEAEPVPEPVVAKAPVQEQDTPAQGPPEEAYSNEWSPEQLAIWRSPEFHEDFMQSFLAETDIEPKLTTLEIEDLQEVRGLIADEKTSEAVAIIEENRAAGSAVWDQMLGNIYFQREEWDQATWAYQAGVEKFPKFRRAWKNLGVVLVRREEFTQAAQAFTKVISLGGGDAITYGLLGFAYSRTEDYIASESAYRMACLLEPKRNEWQMGLVTAFFKQQRFADAVAMCDAMLAKQPTRSDLWLLQGNAYLGLKQPMEAAKNFEFVDTLGKSTPDSLNILGDIYVNEAFYDQAAVAYRKALSATGSRGVAKAIRNAKVLVSRNAGEESRGLIDELEDLYLQEFDEDQRKELLQLKARLAVAAGATEEHIATLLEIIELDPLDGGAMILLGDHYASHDETERAVMFYERAESLSEEHEVTAAKRHGYLLVRLGKYQEGLRKLRRSLEIKEDERLRGYVEDIAKLAGR